jgi:hypothetical protein
MDHLRGCRVVVIDDKPDEAEPIIRALGLRGIPVAYFKISPEDDPPQDPCPPGVRLAILDVELGLNLTGEKQRVGYLLQVLKQVISKENGPYMVVLWTKYPAEKETFDEEIFLEDSLPNPVVSVMLEKLKYGNDLNAIGAKLEEELTKLAPFRILQFWEEASFNAATEVTNLFCQIAESKATNPDAWLTEWQTGVSRLVRAMASEEYGQGLSEPTSALAAFYTSLNPLHGDRMENLTGNPPDRIVQCAQEILGAGDCSEEQRARINTMLHISAEPGTRPWAGKIYALPENGKWPHLPTRPDLVEEFLVANKPRDEEREEKKRWEKERDAVSKACAPVLVEVSPLCDHAQGKVRVLRLLAGLWVPTERRKLFKQPNDRKVGEFLWKLERLYLSTGVPSPGVYDLYLSARLVYSFKRLEENDLAASLRLRTQACTSLQAWFSAHAGRVGLFLLRPAEKTT